MALRALVLIFSFSSLGAFGAACCGGGASLPNLITGDHKSQVSLNFANSAVTHNVASSGKFVQKDDSSQEITETITLRAAYAFSELWQAGFSAPFKKNTYKEKSLTETSSDIGDLKLQFGYEFLPEYSYSRWKPRGFIFIQQSIINSTSVHESKKGHGTDAISSGFSKSSLGISFIKIIKTVDLAFISEYHVSKARSFSSGDDTFEVDPGDGYSALFGAGISPKNGSLRYGFNIVYASESAQKTTGDRISTSSEKLTVDLGFNIGYAKGENSYILSYSDQSYLGIGKNVSASKAISLSFVHFNEL